MGMPACADKKLFYCEIEKKTCIIKLHSGMKKHQSEDQKINCCQSSIMGFFISSFQTTLLLNIASLQKEIQLKHQNNVWKVR